MQLQVLRLWLSCHAHLIAQHCFSPKWGTSAQEFSFALSDIFRLTSITPLDLNPKSLELQHQAKASLWRKPKISMAPLWGAPGRWPLRTSLRTGWRWGTRRKVKRWTTNWLRQKSKNHLALLLPSFLIFWGKTHTEAAKSINVHLYSYLSSHFPPLFSVCLYPVILPVCSLSLPPCTITIRYVGVQTWHVSAPTISHYTTSLLWRVGGGILLMLPTTPTLLVSISRLPWLLAA